MGYSPQDCRKSQTQLRDYTTRATTGLKFSTFYLFFRKAYGSEEYRDFLVPSGATALIPAKAPRVSPALALSMQMARTVKGANNVLVLLCKEF